MSNPLNPAQLEAVEAPLKHQLILAGAGCGKTRVLTHRLVWLVETEKISPFHLMAVTFTNKAAMEMRTRIRDMANLPTQEMWIGTFHGLSHRLLRMHWREANLPEAFQILDASDQSRMIRRIMQSLNLDENRFTPKEAQWFINKQKELGHDPQQAVIHHLSDQVFVKIYMAYQEAANRAGVIDFADLLLKATRLLRDNVALRETYQNRFRSVLVDEFQDTNAIQYAWLKLFVGASSSITLVGDDDQSIYGWRGAEIKNIQNFSRDFPCAQLIRLEQNYRSTSVILAAANAVIAQNTGRLGKNLWTAGNEGDLITLHAAGSEIDEARFVVQQIRKLSQHRRVSDFAVLYRSNAQSRIIEELLMQYQIPYRVYGGLRYFDRAEIKDALAYLRLVTNHADDTSFERILNLPARGIGERTLSHIREAAVANRSSLWDALDHLLTQSVFSSRTENALQGFVNLVDRIQSEIEELPLHTQIELTLHESGLFKHYQKEQGEKGLARIENLEELVNAAHQFEQEVNVDELSPLLSFLSFAALESSVEKGSEKKDAVQLMTLHSAKGLEFPVVFLTGCEEELFPHFLSMNEPKQLEEERRLCYVGMTRAMQKLYLTYAHARFMHGKKSYHRPSRFLREVPQALLVEE